MSANSVCIRETPLKNVRQFVVGSLCDIERSLQSVLLNYDKVEVDHILYKLGQIVYVVQIQIQI